MLAQLSPADKVSIVAIARAIQAESGTLTISALAGQLGVPLMSEARNRKGLVDRLAAQPPAPPAPRVPAFVPGLVATLCERSGGITANCERRSYAPWFKDALVDLHDKGATWVELAALTRISIDTLEGFAAGRSPLGVKQAISPMHQELGEIWQNAAPYHRKTLEKFWLYLQRRHRDLAVTYADMRQILIDLDLYSLRGPKIKNQGAQVKQDFSPHAIWEGDAKQIKVSINGEHFVYYWYAFVDQATTLLVGSTVGAAESSKEFLEALQDGGQNQGTFPVGILIDNRLEGSDIGPIRDFCAKHRIELLRIFPGSSKTNGNIENNFSIFERQVGSLAINASTPQDIGKALVQAVIEVFTQQRNHNRRGRLGDRTPADAAANTKRPEATRNAIEAMARRFERENRQIDEKWEMIRFARLHFGRLEEASINKIKGELGKYPVGDVIAAQAAYLAQIAKHPDRRYGPEYFLAILRNKREEKAKGIYSETYRAGVELAMTLLPRPGLDAVTTAARVVDILLEIQEEPTPAHRMLHLEALCWWLVGSGTQLQVSALWRHVGDTAEATRAMTLRWWTSINEYVTDRIGLSLHCPQAVDDAAALH